LIKASSETQTVQEFLFQIQQKKTTKGTVGAVEMEKRRTNDSKIGDSVLMEICWLELKLEGKDYLIMREDIFYNIIQSIKIKFRNKKFYEKQLKTNKIKVKQKSKKN
jgi:co-chaperonin GroES (HSP10)